MSRISLDDDDDDKSDSNPSQSLPLPSLSPHWQSLTHLPDDDMLETMADLKDALLNDLLLSDGRITAVHAHRSAQQQQQQQQPLPPQREDGVTLAVWSCIVGYMEALATHKKQRYRIFPIPVRALKRLVDDEFIPRIQAAAVAVSSATGVAAGTSFHPATTTRHRELVKAIANVIWSQTLHKPNTRDKWHANSVYVWLRGNIDKKSLDCFGSALITLAGCHLVQQSQQNGLATKTTPTSLTTSRLALSEDHAYETHYITSTDPTDNHGDKNVLVVRGTCEVAVPGNTHAAQAKRGREIGETFVPGSNLTPETSWLYMASNPVICESLGMTLAAVVGNINCTIDKKSGGSSSVQSLASGQLFDVKRELLWVLYDQGHLSKFPFALMELGDCEENRGSPRGSEWVCVDGITEPVLINEKLYLDAIRINKELYDEAQVYPYFLAGHYHKDAGNEGPDSEYRLVHSVRYYAEAARVASKYRYEGVDSLQLNKHMTTIAMLIAEDILRPKYRSHDAHHTPRQWHQRENAVLVGTWLLGFFDSLLKWEELSNDKRFVEILSPGHKHGIGKLFQALEHDVRKEAVSKVLDGTLGGDDGHVAPPCFSLVRSRRMTPGSPLLSALQKSTVSVGEFDVAFVSFQDDDGGDRRSKRVRR
jgi:menin